MKKPGGIRVGRDEKLTILGFILFGLQHVLVMSSTLVLPATIIMLITDKTAVTENFLQWSMFGAGLATILMSLKNRFLGTGYLCPSLSAPGYFSVDVLAIKVGGLPLLCGMNLAANFLMGLFAYVVPKLRQFFPTYVAGIVIFMISLTLIGPGIVYFFSSTTLSHLQFNSVSFMTASFTLLIMVMTNLWGGIFAPYSLMIGVVLGVVASVFFGVLDPNTVHHFLGAQYLAFPHFENFSIHFNVDLLLPFSVAALCVTLQAVGNIMLCQRISNDSWVKPNMDNIKKGILAGSVANMVTSVVGGMPTSTSSSNIGLSVATKTISRFIGVSAGLIFILFSFSPKLAEVFVLIPAPVKGAILLFVASFMMVAGLRIIAMAREDIRKTFVIGFSIISGVAVMLLPPSIIDAAPDFIRPVFETPLALATLVAFFLNMIFRLGIRHYAHLKIDSNEALATKVWRFINKQSHYWLTLPHVSKNAAKSVVECVEALKLMGVKGPIALSAIFDEFTLVLKIKYQGKLPILNVVQPTKEMLLSDKDASIDMAIFLMKKYAGKISAKKVGDNAVIQLEVKE